LIAEILKASTFVGVFYVKLRNYAQFIIFRFRKTI